MKKKKNFHIAFMYISMKSHNIESNFNKTFCVNIILVAKNVKGLFI